MSVLDDRIMKMSVEAFLYISYIFNLSNSSHRNLLPFIFIRHWSTHDKKVVSQLNFTTQLTRPHHFPVQCHPNALSMCFGQSRSLETRTCPVFHLPVIGLCALRRLFDSIDLENPTTSNNPTRFSQNALKSQEE